MVTFKHVAKRPGSSTQTEDPSQYDIARTGATTHFNNEDILPNEELHSSREDQPTSKPPWRRVLYLRQPYPDNYVGPDFFRVTKKRLHVTPVEAVRGCLPVVREVCSCFLLLSAYLGLSSALLPPPALLAASALHTALALPTSLRPALGLAGSAALAGVAVGCLVSVVRSLTASVATDTVHACSAALLCLHVLLHDYGAHVALGNETLSQNVGVFAGVCLASRLRGYWPVLAFTLAAIALFARPRVEQSSDPARTCALVCVTCACVCVYARELAGVYVCGVVVCGAAMPLAYTAMQHHRQNIYGPWDEALPDR